MTELKQTFGNIDVYLFDQLLKGRFLPQHKILDAGCGGGRNLVYFLKNGYDVYAVDQNPEAIAQVRKMSRGLAPEFPLDHIQEASITKLPFEENFFDVVICNAVLHFAKDKTHFEAMLQSLWKVLKPGGYFFSRLTSDIGIEKKVVRLGEGRCLLPDGSERFLVNEQMLLDYTKQLDGDLFEYIKTTNVQGLRAMTTWCVQKRSAI